MENKDCVTCKLNKEISFFEKNKVSVLKNGETRISYRSECKECRKEKKNQLSKNSYDAHKEEINTRRGERVTCDCGCQVRRDSLSRHKKSLNHTKLLEAK